MYFRFVAAVLLVVVAALFGVALEKRILTLNRALTLQQYRTDQLEEHRVRLRLEMQQLGAPARLIDEIDSGRIALELDRTAR
jgi:hypothetical protein